MLKPSPLDPNLRAGYQAFDVRVGALVRKARQEKHSIPCGEGCSACCYDIAWALQPEAREIAERVQSMPTRRRAKVLESLKTWFAGMRAAGLDVDNHMPNVSAYARAHVACPLLDLETRRCMVYAVRPLACRGHYVLAGDASGCADRANNPTVITLTVPGDWFAAAILPYTPDRTALAKLSEVLLPRALERALRALGVLTLDL